MGEVTRFRGFVATAINLAANRPDIHFRIEEICREMPAPSKGSTSPSSAG